MTDISALLIDSGNGWLDSNVPSYLIFKRPEFSVSSSKGNTTKVTRTATQKSFENPLEQLQRYLDKGYTALGYIGYDFLSGIHDRKDPVSELTVDDYGVPDTYFHFYRDRDITRGDLSDLADEIPHSSQPVRERRERSGISSNVSRDQYINLIERAREYIANGDIYQVNISQRFYSNTLKNILDYAMELFKIQPVPYFAYMDFARFQLVSGSMELFLKRSGQDITTRPIKGTIKRSDDETTDQRLRNSLLSSPKERAENIMIVDLMRNDLGRICNPGSVKATSLLDIRAFKTLYQMESEVKGVLKDRITMRDIIESTFPPGSVTGAPKSRCLEIIDELEPHKRGPYCGAIGIFYPDGNFTLSVAIRIVINKPERSIFWVGGGIVWDSDPQKEYEETLLKAKAISKSMEMY